MKTEPLALVFGMIFSIVFVGVGVYFLVNPTIIAIMGTILTATVIKLSEDRIIRKSGREA